MVDLSKMEVGAKLRNLHYLKLNKRNIRTWLLTNTAYCLYNVTYQVR